MRLRGFSGAYLANHRGVPLYVWPCYLLSLPCMLWVSAIWTAMLRHGILYLFYLCLWAMALHCVRAPLDCGMSNLGMLGLYNWSLPVGGRVAAFLPRSRPPLGQMSWNPPSMLLPKIRTLFPAVRTLADWCALQI